MIFPPILIPIFFVPQNNTFSTYSIYLFSYLKYRLTSLRLSMRVLSGTVSHRRSERHGTSQCSRHKWSKCSEATLNTDIQGKIKDPKVSEVGLHSLITQMALRLSKLPLDIKINKKVFQRIV